MGYNMAKPSAGYWEKLSDVEFLFEKGCWNACDSFCCRWNHPDFNFKIIPPGGTLFYMEAEYEYIAKYKKIAKVPVYEMALDYGKNKKLKLCYKSCFDCDNCNKLFSRTLYCKLYPFLPVFNILGELTDVKYISVYDVTLNIIKGATPCSVIKNKQKYFDLWSEKPEILELLKEPYTLFYLIAANLLHDNYVNNISLKSDLLGLDMKAFWSRWEMEYLTGRLVNKAELSVKITETYEQMVKIYGEFI